MTDQQKRDWRKTDHVARSVLGPNEAAYLQKQPLSIVAASRGPDNIPAVARALACRLSPDLRKVTLFFPGAAARELLAHIGGNGTIAVVFSLPSTHESLQLKGSDAAAEAPSQTDSERVDSHRRAFVEHVGNLGYSRTTVETLLTCAHDDLVAVTFTPSAAFSQTPGPNAGRAIGAAK